MCVLEGKMKKQIIIIAFFTLVCSCALNGYQKFYKPYLDIKTLPDAVLLKPEQEPQILGTDNFERDKKILRAKHYMPVGFSSFNGAYEGEHNIKNQARDLGATIVLINAKYTHTLTTTSPLFLPTSTTTHHSGSVMSSGALGTYQGTSTSYGTTVIPITSQEMRYDQTAMFFVKLDEKPKFGVVSFDLSPELKAKTERNMGALIYVVIEDSPAFYSNILEGDILIQIDDIVIINAQQARDVMVSYDTSKRKSVFKIIRNGKEHDITLNFR